MTGFAFLQDFVSLLMQVILNSMQMHGVCPLGDQNLVAYFMHLMMVAQESAMQAAAL